MVNMSRVELKATLKILKGANVGECYILGPDQTVLGRDAACDVVLPRSSISRRHAQIVRDDEGFYIEDLASLNGTFVNTHRLTEPQRLLGGEHIQIDEFLISFRMAGELGSDGDGEIQTERVSLPQPVSPDNIRATFAGDFQVLTGANLRSEVGPQTKLNAILELIRNVGAPLETETVLQRILDTLFQIFPQADRGYVFLAGEKDRRLTPHAIKHRVCEERLGAPTMGPTTDLVARQVIAQGQALLCAVDPCDATLQDDGVLADPVRAMMAVPIVSATDAAIGVIQLDTEDAGRQFIDHDLDLLSCVGRLAGQFIENARQIERNRREAIAAREHTAAERERRWLRAVLDILPVGVFIADARGKLLEANPEARAIWEGEAKQCESIEDYDKHFRAWWPGDMRPVKSEEFGLARALRTGEVCRGEEMEIETLAGNRRTTLNYAGAIRDEDSLLGAVAVNVDITARKQAELELAQANRRKDEFLAMLGHELRNPLAPLRSALAVMSKADLDADTLEWARQLMERQVEHMVRLVDDLLDVSRIERGKFVLRKERVELSPVIAGAVDACQPLIASCGHQLTVSIPKEPIWFDADPVRLTQVVTNLLNNAAKYTERGGQIWLTAERINGEIEVDIRDSGLGICADMLPRIFEPFTQVDQSLDRSQGGLGIGLSLVRTIVELHGGKVSAASEGTGLGSVFSFRIPAPTGIAAPKSIPPALKDGAMTRRKVLVVDDQVGQAQILAKLFSTMWGHETLTAHDGPSALDMMRGERPDIVLLDIGLPGMNGFEVAEHVRSDPQFRDTLLVALTGYGQEEDQRRSEQAGFDLHLVKPPSVTTLKELFAHPKLTNRD